MPNCPKCGQEVDVGQKMCAWCGFELTGGSAPPVPPPQPAPPPSASPPPVGSAGPSINDARELARRGDLEGATRLFLEILERSPNDEEALFGIGGIHFKRNEYKKAAEAWLKLKVINPAYPKIDEWISQARKHLTPSSTSVLGPHEEAPAPPPPVSPPSPPPHHPDTGSVPPHPMELEEWQQQSVKIEKIDEKVHEEPLKPEKAISPSDGETEIVGVGRDQTEVEPWVRRGGWVLVLIYLAICWGIYFC